MVIVLNHLKPELLEYIEKNARISNLAYGIQPEMYPEHNVMRGLRDLNGNGVVTGLTEISEIKSKEKLPDGTVRPCEGILRYRGYNVKELVSGFMEDERFGFEETAYLLLFSKLPSKIELDEFCNVLTGFRTLPDSFVRDMILKASGKDMMNMLSRCVLALYAYDENADDTTVENVLRQALFLISVFPLLAVYSYNAYRHYHLGKNLFIKLPKPEYTTAQNILYMLRDDGKFTDTEAKILDLALVLHAEHGGGNNSSFTTHVVTSSGTDTYSAVSAALGSLKGPRHGGANIKVAKMFDDMHKNIDIENDAQIRQYLCDLLDKKAFDCKGLIYGMGHAVYSVSDPRSQVLHKCVKKLSLENGFESEYNLYSKVAKFAPEIIAEKRKIYKGVSPNVDFYSGLVYKILGLPYELFTPIFAISRITGWSAHRIEEIQSNGKIIRPAYISVKEPKIYKTLNDR